MEPDIIAYNGDHAVLFVWEGCPDVETVEQVPVPNRLAQIAINTAALIRRKDGFIIWSDTGEHGFQTDVELGNEIPAPDKPKEPQRLKRADLIPPPEELPEHAPLNDDEMLRVALFTLLLEQEGESQDVYLIEDRDIIRALRPDSKISIERTETGEVMLRAHLGSLTVVSVTGEAEKKPELDVIDVTCPACDAGAGKNCVTARGGRLSAGNSHADRFAAVAAARST